MVCGKKATNSSKKMLNVGQGKQKVNFLLALRYVQTLTQFFFICKAFHKNISEI